jgi:hypothetical protein
MRKLAAVALLAVSTLSACATRKATSRSLPRERASECLAHCDTLGMRLTAVVVIMDSAGCVCEPQAAPAPSASATPVTGAATIAGGATVAAVIAEQQRQQQPPPSQSGMHPAGSPH